MEFSELFSFLGILIESFKIISKNQKTIAIIAAISILIRSSIFVIHIFSTKQVIENLIGKQIMNLSASLGTPAFPNLLDEMKNSAIFILAIEYIFMLISSVVNLLSVGSTILVTAKDYCGKRLSFQDLVPKLANPFMKQVMTLFHVTIFSIGYIFCFIVLFFPPIVLYFDNPEKIKAFSYAIFGMFLISVMYLSIVWTLAMVITVVENNCFGMEALGTAARLIKGKKIQGFALNFVFVLAVLIIQILTRNCGKASVFIQLVVGIFVISFNFMVLVLIYVSYTVLYFQCKKCHGEEIELGGEMEYSKVALVTEDFP